MNVSYSGFLIHARKYKETSTIIHIFSRNKGIESLIFKGSFANKDKFKFSLFNEYLFSYNDKYSFPYLSKFEIINSFSFHKKYYLLGLYVNELLYKTMREGYDYEKIYEHYKSFLINLLNTSSSTKRLALVFEKNFIDHLGYGLYMLNDKDINDNLLYSYDFDEGFKISDSAQNKFSLPGSALRQFFSDTLENDIHIDIIRLIIKRTLNRHYENINLIGDKLL
jgi:DNA repair protein RecO (recombination protein O)